jgi:cytochrome P450
MIFRLMKFLNIPFVPKSLSSFFKRKIESNIKFREKENKSRADMIQLLLDARKADPDKCMLNIGAYFLSFISNIKILFLDIDDSDIASQAFTFFLGGFDTMATGFSFLSHRLALHPDIQTKVREEVREVMEKNDGKMT